MPGTRGYGSDQNLGMQLRQTGTEAMLEIDPQTVYFLILKAREFDDKDSPGEEDLDASPAEQTIEANMHYYADDPVAQELKDAIEALNDDEQAELVALTWVGRGDFTSDEWDEVVRTARAHTRHWTVSRFEIRRGLKARSGLVSRPIVGQAVIVPVRPLGPGLARREHSLGAVERAGLTLLNEGPKVEYEIVPGQNSESSVETPVVLD